MSSWRDLETQFHKLEPSMEQARLERQWDSAADDWRLGGKVDLASAKQFREAATAAGALLQGPEVEVPAEVAAETDPMRRWFLALWHMTGPHDPPITGMMSLHGTDAGPVSIGRVQRPAHHSRTLALRFQTGHHH